MGISRYPRFGHRLAPVTLREILPVSLRDLDESVWMCFTPEVCKKLAKAVVEQVQAAHPSFQILICKRHLPKPPKGTKLSDLELEVRTYNCLKGAGFLRGRENLGDQTIGEILKIRGFGAKCLVDLLTSLEAFTRQAKPGRCFKPELDRKLTMEAKKLRQLHYASTIHRDDTRLGYLIGSMDRQAKTVGEIVDRLVNRSQDPPNPDGLSILLKELRRRIRKFSGMKLEDELMDLVVAAGHSKSSRLSKSNKRKEHDFIALASDKGTTRNSEIVARRLGWDGQGGNSLQAVGDRFGVTRERVRQICDHRISELKGKNPFAPILDRVLKFVTKHLPGSADEIESMLVSRGLTRSVFRLEGLLTVAEPLGREVPFTIVRGGKDRFAVTLETKALPNLILQVARKSITHWGVATVMDIAAQTEETAGIPIKENIVIQVLVGQEGFQWLDEKSGWFWLRSVPRNRLLNQIGKILSVVERIQISELRYGISRHHRMAGFAPPRRVLLELSRQLPRYRVLNNTIFADPRIDWKEELRETEKTMVRVLKKHGPVMLREEFEKLCLDLGMNRHTFYVYLEYSPIISQYARGVYGLRGAEVPPGLVESVMPKRSRRKRLLDYRWTPNGEIWLCYRLSENIISTGVIGVPAKMRRFLEGEFVLKAADGSHVGTLVCKDSNAWGLGPFFRRRGGDPGDHLFIRFDLAAREAAVRIGDATLLQDFCDDDREPAFISDQG